MAQHDIEVVDPHPAEAHVDAFDNAAGREVEMRLVISAQLAPEIILVAGNVAEGNAEQALAHSPAVEGGRVDEIHPQIEGDAHRAEGLLNINLAEFLAEG